MRHGRQHRRVLFLAVLMLAAALSVLVGVQVAGTATAQASERPGRGTTVRTTINLPAFVVDNLCNADVVNLHGDLHIVTTTTPTGNGGYTVRSTAIARDLQGNRIAPAPAIRYHGDDGENSFSYYAPPPFPSTHRDVHWTTLIPQGNAPRMFLVLVLRETIAPDGTVVPVFERAYLTCQQPSCSDERIS